MRRPIRWTTLAGVLATTALLMSVATTGCSPAEERGGDLTGIDWVLKSYSLKGEITDVPPSGSVTARFAADKIAGKALNSYNGTFNTDDDGNVTQVGPIASTKMAGPPELMTLETAYFAALEKAESYYSDGTTLTLYGADEEELAAYEKSTVSLVGKWDVTSYNNGKQAVVSVISTTSVTAEFGADGKVSGNGGINSYGGSYTTEGANAISVGQLNSTMMAGPQEVMDQEAAYLKALQSATKYSISGDQLEMRDDSGALQVQAAAAP